MTYQVDTPLESQFKSLEPCGFDVARAAYATLVGMAARGEPDEATAVAIAAQAVRDLADLPGFALKEACRRFRTGLVGDGTWRPTVGEIAKEARRISGPLEREAALSRQHVALPSPIDRRIAPERWEALKSQISGVVKKTKEDYEKDLYDYENRARGKPLPKLSNEALSLATRQRP